MPKKSTAKRRPKGSLNPKAKAELALWVKADKALAGLHEHLTKQPNGVIRTRYFDWSPRHGLIEHCTARLEITADPKAKAKAMKAAKIVAGKLRWVKA